MLFNVITALVRPQNLDTILNSILVSRGSTAAHIRWIFVVDELALSKGDSDSSIREDLKNHWVNALAKLNKAKAGQFHFSSDWGNAIQTAEQELQAAEAAYAPYRYRADDTMATVNEVHSAIASLKTKTASLRNFEVDVLVNRSIKSPANVGFEAIQDGLICLVDDDNIMHPRYIEVISENAQEMTFPDYGFVYAQNLGRNPTASNRKIRLFDPRKIRELGAVDTAQITLTRKLLGDYRWPDRDVNLQVTSPDSRFINEIFFGNQDKFRVLNDCLCYYNYLKNEHLDFS